MRVTPDDPAARVEFIFRGDPDGSFTLPIEARPRTWVRAINVGMVCGLAGGGLAAGPVAAAAPGPAGVLATAATALTLGVAGALTIGRAISEADTPERPLRAHLAAAAAETLTDRSQPATADTTHAGGAWTPPAATTTRPDPNLWRTCAHPSCAAQTPHPPVHDRRTRQPHHRP